MSINSHWSCSYGVTITTPDQLTIHPQYDYLPNPSVRSGRHSDVTCFTCRSWWLSSHPSRTSRVSASLSSSSASCWASSPSRSSWWRRPIPGPGSRGWGSHCRTSPQISSPQTPSTPPGYQVRQSTVRAVAVTVKCQRVLMCTNIATFSLISHLFSPFFNPAERTNSRTKSVKLKTNSGNLTSRLSSPPCNEYANPSWQFQSEDISRQQTIRLTPTPS